MVLVEVGVNDLLRDPRGAPTEGQWILRQDDPSIRSLCSELTRKDHGGGESHEGDQMEQATMSNPARREIKW